MLTGPAPARVTLFGHTRIGGLVSRPGRYLLRSHYMPFWKVSGAVCLQPARNGMTWLDASAAGRFRSSPSPTAAGFVQAVDRRPRRLVSCRQLGGITSELEAARDAGSPEAGVPPSRIELAVEGDAQPAGGRRARARGRDGLRGHGRHPGDVASRLGRAGPAAARARGATSRPVVELVAGVLRSQVEQVLIDPYAERHSRDAATRWVFERKYELDSLCAPLSLAWLLWRTTGSTAHVDGRFREAARAIVELWRREQDARPGSYVFRRRFARRTRLASRQGAREAGRADRDDLVGLPPE